MTHDCTRRELLRAASGLAFGAGWMPAIAAAASRPFRTLERARRLVLVDLFGGLDGLSAIVPYADDLYYRARPHLAVEPREVQRLDDYKGFSPAMRSLRAHWEGGRMAVVQGVGYERQNLSHFKSCAIWQHALPANGVSGDGWIARLRAQMWPLDECPELVTSIGRQASGALYSAEHPCLHFESPQAFSWIGAEDVGAAQAYTASEEAPGETVLARLRAMHESGLRLAPAVLQIVRDHPPRVEYPRGEFARRLRTLSALLRAGFGARVYSLTHESFDSHSAGLHSQEDVLREFCEGIDAFLRDIAGTSAEEDCLVLCTSEFGRRLAENAARGTDHGAAGPVFLFGRSVVGGLHGSHPSLEDLDDTGSLRHGTDFRSVYAALIEQWFQGRHELVLQQQVPVPRLIEP